MSDELLIKTAIGAYGHDAMVATERAPCDVCKRDSLVLTVDTSQGEYATLRICRDCIETRFAASAGG